MSELLLRHRAAGVRQVAFGDLFLADIRAYREQQLARVGMSALFPLWGRDTPTLAREVQRLGYRAVVTCVDTERLSPEFAGRDYDADFLADLPEGVDLCGENGEFHTFVWDGPVFRQPVRFTRGERVRREGRWEFCDLRGQGSEIRRDQG
jgi:diphthamide synthase (EF-2-diphthine--ammonia ligase)